MVHYDGGMDDDDVDSVASLKQTFDQYGSSTPFLICSIIDLF